MKKLIVGFIAGLIMATSVSVYADEGLEKIEAYVRKGLPITLDGKKVELDNPAVMVDGSTYLRLRDVGKITGVGVDWNEATQTVELKSVELKSATVSGVAPTPTPGSDVKVPALSDMQRQILELKEQIRGIPLLIDNLKRSIEMAKIDLARNPNDETAKKKIENHEARIKEYEAIKARFEQELAQLEALPTP